MQGITDHKLVCSDKTVTFKTVSMKSTENMHFADIIDKPRSTQMK